MTFSFNRVRAVVEVHVHGKYHQAQCSGSWVNVYTTFFVLPRKGKKNPIIRSCDLDLSPMTLKFNRIRPVVKEHVRAKFHRAEYSGSWVMNTYEWIRKLNIAPIRQRPQRRSELSCVQRQKQTNAIQSVATARTVKLGNINLFRKFAVDV